MGDYRPPKIFVSWLFFWFWVTLSGARPIQELQLLGLERTRPEVIIRELHLQRGMEPDSTLLREDLLRLENLELFSDIRQNVLVDSLGRVILVYSFHERWSMLPIPLIQWDEEMGTSWGFGFLDFNFRGLHEEVTFQWLTGGYRELSLEYLRPWNWDRRLALEFELSRNSFHNSFEDFREENREFRTGVRGFYGENNFWDLGPFYREVFSDSTSKILDPSGRDRFMGLQVANRLTTYDVLNNPTRGWRVVASVEVGEGGNTAPSYSTWDLMSGGVIPLGRRLRLAGGWRWVHQAGRVPAYHNKYTGGSWGVRSYVAGFRGRPRMAVASLELRAVLLTRRELFRHFDFAANGVVFFDWGSSWEEEFVPPFAKFFSGPGCGLHLYFPLVGLARIEAGYNPARGEWVWQISNDLRY